MPDLDDQLKRGTVKDLRGGVNDDVHPSQISRQEAAAIVNWDITGNKLGKKRMGYVAGTTVPSGADLWRVWGMREFAPPGGTREFMVGMGEKVYSWLGPGTALTEVQTSTGDDPLLNDAEITMIQCRNFNSQSHECMVINSNATAYAYNGSGSLRAASDVPQGTTAVFFLERLWIGTSDGLIKASDFGDPLAFNPLNQFLVGSGRPIKRLMTFGEAGIVVWLEDEIWRLDLDQFRLFSGQLDGTLLWRVNKDLGTVSPRSVVQAGQDFFFLSRHGVHRMSKTEQDKPLGLTVPISEKIRETVERINFEEADSFCGAVWNNLYMLAVAVDGSSTVNLMLVYDMRTNSWTTYDSWTPGDFAATKLGGVKKLYFGNSSGDGLIYEAFSGYTDDSSDVTASIEFREEDFDLPFVNKEFAYLEVFGAVIEGGEVNVYVKKNGGSYILLGQLDLSGDLPQLPIDMGLLDPPGFWLHGGGALNTKFSLRSLGHCRTVQFKFETTGDEQIEVLQYTLAGYVDEERLN